MVAELVRGVFHAVHDPRKERTANILDDEADAGMFIAMGVDHRLRDKRMLTHTTKDDSFVDEGCQRFLYSDKADTIVADNSA